ncbi:MAG: methyltransferase [Defluviitaleaceae bacterium]|nr:methyltransferase [Defluviitaleaceae bacterium]
MKQYFSENPEILTREREISINIYGADLRFLTNNGLFSCDKIDENSLALVENMPEITGDLLDLGCGYGFIGIALAKREPTSAASNFTLTMSDINRIALAYAEKNAALNNVAAKFIHSDSFEKIPDAFDCITLNPPIHAGKEAVYRMYEESAAHLRPGGSFFIVIQKKHGAESSVKKLAEIFSRVEILHKRKGCHVIRAVAPRAFSG